MQQNLAQELEFETCIPPVSIDRFSPAQFIFLLSPESLCIKSSTILTVVDRFRKKRGAI